MWCWIWEDDINQNTYQLLTWTGFPTAWGRFSVHSSICSFLLPLTLKAMTWSALINDKNQYCSGQTSENGIAPVSGIRAETCGSYKLTELSWESWSGCSGRSTSLVSMQCGSVSVSVANINQNCHRSSDGLTQTQIDARITFSVQCAPVRAHMVHIHDGMCHWQTVRFIQQQEQQQQQPTTHNNDSSKQRRKLP